jgi:3-dehydrosphinganine reductase
MKLKESMWRGKTILVTGGSSGIGLEIARLLVRRGGKVWLLARRLDLLQEASRILASEGGLECGILPADVSDPTQVVGAIERLQQQDGPPFALFNSAGLVHPGYVQDLDLEVFYNMMDVNYHGTVNVVKSVLPSMLERKAGIIVNIASIAGFLGFFGYTAYGASKFAVRGFTDVLRLELKPFGIQVSIAFPPDTDTPQLVYDNQLRPPEPKEMEKIWGITHPMHPRTVAEIILKGVERGRYIILPGKDAVLLFWLTNILGAGTYRVLDIVLNRARKNLGKV